VAVDFGLGLGNWYSCYRGVCSLDISALMSFAELIQDAKNISRRRCCSCCLSWKPCNPSYHNWCTRFLLSHVGLLIEIWWSCCFCGRPM